MHHANIIVSKRDCKNFVFDILAKDLDFKTVGNPDFMLIEKESFGIDDARDLERWAIGKPLLGEVKAYLLIAKSITLEAQNALLKILEEPPLGTYIFINLQSLGGILPTFISRIKILNFSESDSKDDIAAKKFLVSSIKEKLSLIHSLSKKEDKNQMKELLKNLEEIACQNNLPAENLKNILTAKIFASARGSSPKMLLEWLASVL